MTSSSVSPMSFSQRTSAWDVRVVLASSEGLKERGDRAVSSDGFEGRDTVCVFRFFSSFIHVVFRFR